MKKKNTNDKISISKRIVPIVLAVLLLAIICGLYEAINNGSFAGAYDTVDSYSQTLPDGFVYSDVPKYSGQPFCDVNGGTAFFSDTEVVGEAYEAYGNLDRLGRCTGAVACLSTEVMPQPGEERGDIGEVKPSGWKPKKYDCVDGNLCVNRTHLIAWSLSAENANEQNLVTGTRYMNLEMENLESETRRYIKKSGHHVMYRVTPDFCGTCY